jgi:SAM-dependent methyltransferase
LLKKPGPEETRTQEQIREHYEIEKELANRLTNASRSERRHLYSTLYDELYSRVPLHPQLTRKISIKKSAERTAAQMQWLKYFISDDMTFLEIGPGDCSLSFEVAKFVKRVYAVDVSEKITLTKSYPKNFQLIISDGTSIPIPLGIINLAYSNQLMEHLHPDDALEQLRNIYCSLMPGGRYICITPNRLYDFT